MWIFRSLLIVSFGLLSVGLVVAQHLKVDVDAVRSLLANWNEAHTLNKVENLESLYADEVIFYGSVLTRENCVSKKRSMLERQDDFSQEINPDIVLSAYSSGVIRCDFIKTVSSNKKTFDYNSYLIIKERAGEYVIVGESDLTTDSRTQYKPDLGNKVAIEKGTLVKTKVSSSGDGLEFSTPFLVGGGLAIGLIGLWVAFRTPKTKVPKLPQSSEKPTTPSEPLKFPTPIIDTDRTVSDEALPVDKYYAMGLEFEKFVVAKFARNKKFTLLEWRSDKFHLGIFPESNRNPDLEYKYQEGNLARTFSIECKYRSRVFTGSIILMNETKYGIYEAFHRSKMPVYILLGVGGGPEWPEELYLIPFQHLKPKMSYGELTKYLKRGDFSYDLKRGRLT
jgi:hypothetical protein